MSDDLAPVEADPRAVRGRRWRLGWPCPEPGGLCFAPVPSRAVPRLGEAEVAVWKATVDDGEGAFWGEGILSPRERERAGRFRFPSDRLRFVTGRVVLRLLLSAYTGTPARQLVLEADEAGKLRLGHPEAPGTLHFNHSHSGQVVLLAFTRGRQVGVDVECLGERVAYEEILQVLSAEERVTVQSAPSDAFEAALVRAWVRKEARLKARGTGLRGLREPRPGTASGDESDWRVQDVVLDSPYLGALAAQGRDWQARGWEWSQELAAALDA